MASKYHFFKKKKETCEICKRKFVLTNGFHFNTHTCLLCSIKYATSTIYISQVQLQEAFESMECGILELAKKYDDLRKD